MDRLVASLELDWIRALGTLCCCQTAYLFKPTMSLDNDWGLGFQELQGIPKP